MRKTVIYILILGVLGFGVWYFLFNDTSVFEVDEAGFTIQDTAAVYKIFLADKGGDTISLTRTDDGWMVNGEYRASKRMTNTLLETFRQQFAAYPVQEAAHNNVIMGMAGTAIKTEIFNKNGRVLKTFYVGGQVTGNKGTYMLMEGAQRPYVVQLPAYQGYVTPRYSTKLHEWRDRTVVDLSPQQLESVQVDYAQEDEYLNSFTLARRDDGSLTVYTHPELKMTGEPNPAKVRAYAGYFQKVGLEGYLDGVTALDSIIASVPKRGTVTIKGRDGFKRQVDIYRMYIGKRSKNLSEDTTLPPPTYDADRYYGIVGGDTVILQTQIFDKILRRGYEFYGTEEQ